MELSDQPEVNERTVNVQQNVELFAMKWYQLIDLCFF